MRLTKENDPVPNARHGRNACLAVGVALAVSCTGADPERSSSESATALESGRVDATILEGAPIRVPHALIGAGPSEPDWIGFQATAICDGLEGTGDAIRAEIEDDLYQVTCGDTIVRGRVIRPEFDFEAGAAPRSVEEADTIGAFASQLCPGRFRGKVADRNAQRAVWRVQCRAGPVYWGWISYTAE